MRFRIALAISSFAVILLMFVVWRRSAKQVIDPSVSDTPPHTAVISGAPFAIIPGTSDLSDSAPTNVSAHNLKLRKGPGFRIYVRRLRGQMIRMKRNVNPSFDDPESFVLDVKTGVILKNNSRHFFAYETADAICPHVISLSSRWGRSGATAGGNYF